MSEALPSLRPFTPAALALSLMTWATVSTAADIRVPADQATIQKGIDAAVDGDRVLVSPGTYFEHIYVRKSISIVSTDGAGSTLIDGSNDGTVATLYGGGEPILRGFTIIHGNDDGQLESGGGVTVGENTRPSIENNDFEYNIASQGAAIYVSRQTAARIHGNAFRHNEATYGAAIDLESNSGRPGTSIDNNLFERNGCGQCSGGAIFAEQSWGVHIERNEIRDNVSRYGGAALAISEGTFVVADNLIFDNRSSLKTEGAVYINMGRKNADLIFVNNTVAGNVGGELYLSGAPDGHPSIANNIFLTTRGQTSIFCSQGKRGNVEFTHNLVFSTNGATSIGDCDLKGGGLITSDPMFVGGDGGHDRHAFWLAPGSPAIDAGDDSAVHGDRDLTGAQRIQGAAVDLGAIEFRVH
jgi:hypothetical protein